MKTIRCRNLQLATLFFLLLLVSSPAWAQNPVPFVDILNPTSIYPSHGDFTLTISGANFANGATVQFDGLTLTPTAVTRNSLTVTVPASAVASAHTASITVMNPSSSSSNVIKSNVAFFPITSLKAGLAWTNAISVPDPRSRIGVDSGPPATAIAVGDFNGDGHQDVVVALPGILEVYTGDGNGNFTAASSVSTPGVGFIFAMEVGDFNNDGRLDVAATDGGSVGIYFNDGTGNLTAGPTTSLPTWDATRCDGAVQGSRFGVADINGDGFLDLVFRTSVGPEVVVLLGDGLGHFSQSSAVTLSPVNDFPFDACSVSVGDFNNDGWVDIAYGTSLGQAVFAFNDGAGGFSSANIFTQGYPFLASFPGDMNGDGFLDLVTGNASEANIFKNQQNGTFALTGPFTLPSPVCCVNDLVLGDLNGGGALDAFIAFPMLTNQLIVDVGDALIGNGSGSLSSNAPLSGASLAPLVVRLGDFNEDGRLDVVYTGSTAPNVSQNSVAFEYWLQIPGPPIWSIVNPSFDAVVLTGGQMPSGQQQPITETLSNSGPSVLNILNISSRPPSPNALPDFPILAAASTCPVNGGTLQPGDSCTVVLSFQPSTFGSFSETLSVVDDANGVPGSVQNVTLTGTAIELDASVQSPVKADGTSVFNASRGVVPVKFTLQQNGVMVGKDPGPGSCQLPLATIGIIRTAGGAIGPIDTADFEMAADNGASFRVDTTSCQYVYNLDARALGPGTYSVQILVGPIPGVKPPSPNVVGTATFGLR